MQQVTTAQQRKENGQAKAAAKAGADWYTEALAHLRRYIAIQRKTGASDFTMDEFREWATSIARMPEPVSLNAWGALPRVAKADNVIASTGAVDTAKRAASHGRLVRVWRAA